MSEWKLTVDEKGPAAANALDHIAWVLRKRRTPVERVTARRMRVPSHPDRVDLQLREGFFTGVRVVFRVR